MTTVFPFTAIAGHREFTDALTLCAIDPGIGGVLALGDRGTGKTTTVRALGALLDRTGTRTPVVDIPLGVTEDRLIGSMDLDAALREGRREFSPGLLAEADGGFLYIDEINLLDDHLVDVLLDVAASGENVVEREGVSHRHSARFVLVGSGNPEEGDLRPQLEDRFGLCLHVTTIGDPSIRVEIVRRRLEFDEDPTTFIHTHAAQEQGLADQITRARQILTHTYLDDDKLAMIIGLCVDTGTVGHRGELVLARAARARAAWRAASDDAAPRVGTEDVRHVAPMVLRHRVPREPFDTPETIDSRLLDVIGSKDHGPDADA